uniref:Proline-rich secreted protein n=1 Tax=Antricola delacruzi TaxID=480319 RepID=M4GY07_ANTDE
MKKMVAILCLVVLFVSTLVVDAAVLADSDPLQVAIQPGQAAISLNSGAQPQPQQPLNQRQDSVFNRPPPGLGLF